METGGSQELKKYKKIVDNYIDNDQVKGIPQKYLEASTHSRRGDYQQQVGGHMYDDYSKD